MGENNQEKKLKSSKIPSVLDTLCKTSILDESDDFILCESVNKFKNSKNESTTKNNKNGSTTKSSTSDIVLCEICKEGITHLDVHSRAVHVNNCIDKQIAVLPEPEVQASESENIFILECPLCFKHFPTPELRTNHIKKCGKSKGLTIQCIVKALKLQERHALERISLGLPAKPIKPVKSHKSAASKRVIVEPKSKVQSDIQLAKALSLSLANTNKQNEEDNNHSITYVTLKPPNSNQHPGKKTKKVVCTPVLVLRTEEERKKLLLDKVATIVAPQVSYEHESLTESTESSSPEKKNINPSELPLLWQLTGKALEKNEYYVENLLDWIQPSDVEVGAKLCHLSQIAGHEIVTQLPLNYTFDSQEAEKENYEESSETSPPSLIGCLRSLVASSWMSDVDIYTACGTVIPAHRLLLAVRCPPLKQDLDFCSNNGRVPLKWESTSFDVALQFLNFVYTGNIEIEESMKSDLLYLANKYEVCDLQALLLTNKRIDIQAEVQINHKVSEEFGEVDLSPPPSQTQASEHESSTPCETQGDTNMDLEIVYNCINSTLKPSQIYVNEPPSPLPVDCDHLRSVTNFGHSSNLNGNDSVPLDNHSEQCTISNCVLPANESPASPVIFNISDSDSDMDVDSDNESIELPINCSQRSALQECNLGERELDLCSTEGNNSSQDSVKFLESSFPTHDSLPQSPVKEKNCLIFTPPKLSVDHFDQQSPLAIKTKLKDSQKSDCESCIQKENASEMDEFHSDEYRDLESRISHHITSLFSEYNEKFQTNNESMPRDSPKSDCECCIQKENASEISEFQSDEYAKLESPVLPHPESLFSQLHEKYQTNDENVSRDSQKSNKSCIQNKNVSEMNEFHSDEYAKVESPTSSHLNSLFSKFTEKCQPNNEINMKEISTVDRSEKNAVVYQVYDSDVAEADNINEEFDRDYGGNVTPAKGFSFSESSVLSSPKKQTCSEKTSPPRIACSPEVLICDSDSGLKSPVSISCERFTSHSEEDDVFQSQRKFSSHSIEPSEKSSRISMGFQGERDSLEKISENADTFVFLPSSMTDNQLNFNSRVSLERKRAMSPVVLCPTSDEDNTSSPVRNSFLGKEKCELKENFSFSDLPIERVESSKLEGSSVSPRMSDKSFDDLQYECYDYFDHDAFSPPNPKTPELLSPQNIKIIKDDQITKSGSSASKQMSSKPFDDIQYEHYDYFEHEVLSSPNLKTPELHSPQKSKVMKDNHVSKPAIPASSTQPRFQMTDSPITPFPDYKNMVTPEIKQALRKIGVKALPRKKAVAILSHVYNETHPLIDGEINTESCSSKTTSNIEKVKKRKKSSENVAKRAKKQETKVHCPEASNGTQDSDDSSSENPEWQGCVPEMTFTQCTQDSPTKATKDDIECIKQYIQSNEELYHKILTYVPLNLVAFHQELKDNGMKISIQKLMDFLDEQCITFTCPRKEQVRKKQTARAQRFRKNMIKKLSQQTS